MRGRLPQTPFGEPSRTTPLGPDLGLDGIAADALATANTYRQAATDLANGATAPLTSWGALRDAVAGTGEDGAAALDEATASRGSAVDAMGARWVARQEVLEIGSPPAGAQCRSLFKPMQRMR